MKTCHHEERDTSAMRKLRGVAPRAKGTAALGCKAKRFEPQYLYYFCVVCSYFPRKGIGVAAKQPPSEIYVLVRQSPLKSVLTRAEKLCSALIKKTGKDDNNFMNGS